MSGLGALQKKMTDLEMKLPGALRTVVDPGGSISPHQEQYRQQQEMNQHAADLEAQQAADASLASEGPQSVGIRSQNAGDSISAGGVAGMSLYAPRPRRNAARRSVTGY